MMGMSDVDESVTLDIGRNIDYLNNEFENRIVFEIGKMFMDENHAYIPDLHDAAIGHGDEDIEDIVDPIEIAGSINIYIFDTYSKRPDGAAMMGFTPVLSRMRHTYEHNSPQFDRIFLSYPGLKDLTTLVHEMGHFLGLNHPWDLNHINKHMMGLTDDDTIKKNHMSYGLNVAQFTEEQLDRMQHFAKTFRSYLLSNQEDIVHAYD